ncbi:MAG: pyridoxamine 5'-phosphate oxidase family protein [Acidimicrobiia bacterium]|nr:pyridoxamine 5'-phosphate oxidase family protein [Acidimicrobiia bacterium]
MSKPPHQSQIRTDVRRQPDRQDGRRTSLNEILDSSYVAHVSFVVDGSPRVIPTLHARAGDVLYLHGSPAAGFLRAARKGQELCVAVTQLDGLVLARSAFHHSANYRSAVIYGAATRIEDPSEKRSALDTFVDAIIPDRRSSLREMTDTDIRQTEIVSVPLDEWSVKTRTGPPSDEEEDYALPIWAGVVPLTTVHGAPEPDHHTSPDLPLPEHLKKVLG